MGENWGIDAKNYESGDYESGNTKAIVSDAIIKVMVNPGKPKKKKPLIPPRDSLLDTMPREARVWAENLSWNERRYLLSICYLMSGSSPEAQARFLDEYTADGLVSRMLADSDTLDKVRTYLQNLQVTTPLAETVLRDYIRQFYIHSAQDVRVQPEIYLESALRLVGKSEERYDVFNYILGFEVLKIIFQMSWLEQERLYRVQKNQEEFFHSYIKPIQYTHKVNGIIVPKNEKMFFARRDYYIQKPELTPRKTLELIMATFTTKVVINLGFSLIRNTRFLVFDYDYIYNAEPEEIFPNG